MSTVSTLIGIAAISGAGYGLFTVFSSGQNDLAINPGLWETTTTVTSNLAGTQSQTTTECMTADSFDPEQITQSLLQGAPAEQCDTDSDIWGDTVSFEMDCDMDGGSITASGSWTFSGDEGSGSMEMDMQVSGMSMTMEMESIGERIDDC